MKYKAIIEETLVQEFFIEADSFEEADDKAYFGYKHKLFVLENGEVSAVQYQIMNEDGTDVTEWREIR